MGVCYILDEPSIGLHQRDNDKLLATLKQLSPTVTARDSFFRRIPLHSLQGVIRIKLSYSAVLIHGTGGKEVTVYYEGQRGKGEYPIAFEGLIRNVARRYRETGSESSKAEYESLTDLGGQSNPLGLAAG